MSAMLQSNNVDTVGSYC